MFILFRKRTKFEKFCKEYNIAAIEKNKLVKYFKNPLGKFDLLLTKNNSGSYLLSTKIKFSYNLKTDKIIALGKDHKNSIIIKWHELGHILHPLGGFDSEIDNILICELAASSWALKHCDEGDSDENKRHLRWAFWTYVKHQRKDIPDTPENRMMAKALYVEHWLEWIA